MYIAVSLVMGLVAQSSAHSGTGKPGMFLLSMDLALLTWKGFPEILHRLTRKDPWSLQKPSPVGVSKDGMPHALSQAGGKKDATTVTILP